MYVIRKNINIFALPRFWDTFTTSAIVLLRGVKCIPERYFNKPQIAIFIIRSVYISVFEKSLDITLLQPCTHTYVPICMMCGLFYPIRYLVIVRIHPFFPLFFLARRRRWRRSGGSQFFPTRLHIFSLFAGSCLLHSHSLPHMCVHIQPYIRNRGDRPHHFPPCVYVSVLMYWLCEGAVHYSSRN